MKHFSHIDGDVILQNLQKVLDSKAFSRSGRLRTFLEYVVRKEQLGLSNQLKGYAIGVDVFSRSDSFDPGGDPLVRVQAGKLRKLLDEYYACEGKDAPVRIRIPRGSYIPAYEWKNPIAVADISAPHPRQTMETEAFPPAGFSRVRPWSRYRLWVFAIIAVTIINLGALGIQTATLLAGPRPQRPPENQVFPHDRDLSALPQIAIRINQAQSSRLAPLAEEVRAAVRQMNSVELVDDGSWERRVPRQDPRLDFTISLSISGTPERTAIVLHHNATGKFLFAKTYDGSRATSPTDFLYQANSFVDEALAIGGKLYRHARFEGTTSPLMACLTVTTQYSHQGSRDTFLQAVQCQQGLATANNPFSFITNLRSLREFARRSDLEHAMAAPEPDKASDAPAI